MKAEPWTRARVEHAKHLLFVEDCEWCIRRLEEAQEDTRNVIPYESTADTQMDFCTLHGAINCKLPSCYACGNHALDDDGRCTDPRCHSATRLPFFRPSPTEGIIPGRAYPGDAGLDLSAAEPRSLAPGEFVDVPVNMHVAVPDGYFARITGRSSTFRKRGIMVIEGVIDAGYRGPLYVGCWNPKALGEVIQIEAGERIAQMLIHRVERLDPVEVDELPESVRGERGVGSSGK